MSELGPDATRQAGHDAAAKPTITTGRPQAALSWFLNRSWKVKFFLVVILMFLAYSVVSTVLEFTGLRAPQDGPEACARDLPIEQRARCIIEREDALAARANIAQGRENAAIARDEAEQQKLEDEKLRQRAIADARPHKRTLHERLLEFANGTVEFRDQPALVGLSREVNKMLRDYLASTDHPLNQRLPQWKNTPRDVPLTKVNPPEWREAKAALDKACPLPVMTVIAARVACADAIASLIEKVSYQDAENIVERLVLTTPKKSRP